MVGDIMSFVMIIYLDTTLVLLSKLTLNVLVLKDLVFIIEYTLVCVYLCVCCSTYTLLLLLTFGKL